MHRLLHNTPYLQWVPRGMGILLTMFQPACAASGPRLGAPGLVFSRIACAVANIDLEWSDVSGAMQVFRPFYGPSPVSPGAQRRLSRICEIHTPGQGGDVWRFNNFPWGIFDIPWREGVWVPTTKKRRSVGRNGMVLTFHLQARRQEGRRNLRGDPDLCLREAWSKTTTTAFRLCQTKFSP